MLTMMAAVIVMEVMLIHLSRIEMEEKPTLQKRTETLMEVRMSPV